jgi:hypothetical protein
MRIFLYSASILDGADEYTDADPSQKLGGEGCGCAPGPVLRAVLGNPRPIHSLSLLGGCPGSPLCVAESGKRPTTETLVGIEIAVFGAEPGQRYGSGFFHMIP